jgi:hypothetical protein
LFFISIRCCSDGWVSERENSVFSCGLNLMERRRNTRKCFFPLHSLCSDRRCCYSRNETFFMKGSTVEWKSKKRRKRKIESGKKIDANDSYIQNDSLLIIITAVSPRFRGTLSMYSFVRLIFCSLTFFLQFKKLFVNIDFWFVLHRYITANQRRKRFTIFFWFMNFATLITKIQNIK